eukprot:gene7642-biopygen7568
MRRRRRRCRDTEWGNELQRHRRCRTNVTNLTVHGFIGGRTIHRCITAVPYHPPPIVAWRPDSRGSLLRDRDFRQAAGFQCVPPRQPFLPQSCCGAMQGETTTGGELEETGAPRTCSTTEFEGTDASCTRPLTFLPVCQVRRAWQRGVGCAQPACSAAPAGIRPLPYSPARSQRGLGGPGLIKNTKKVPNSLDPKTALLGGHMGPPPTTWGTKLNDSLKGTSFLPCSHTGCVRDAGTAHVGCIPFAAAVARAGAQGSGRGGCRRPGLLVRPGGVISPTRFWAGSPCAHPKVPFSDRASSGLFFVFLISPVGSISQQSLTRDPPRPRCDRAGEYGSGRRERTIPALTVRAEKRKREIVYHSPARLGVHAGPRADSLASDFGVGTPPGLTGVGVEGRDPLADARIGARPGCTRFFKLSARSRFSLHRTAATLGEE